MGIDQSLSSQRKKGSGEPKVDELVGVLSPKLSIIEALPSRRELELKVLSTVRCESILAEVIDQLRTADADPYRWKLSLLLKSFQNTAGEVISGKEILLALTESAFRDQFPTSKKSINQINETLGHSMNDVYDSFLEKRYAIPPLNSIIQERCLSFSPTGEFNKSKLADNDPKVLAELCRRLCAEVFHGDVLGMSPELLSKATVKIELPEEQRSFSGAELLSAYSVSRFKQDHSAAPKSEKSILAMQGYKVMDSLLLIRQEVLKERLKGALELSVSIPSLEAIDSPQLEERKAATEQVLVAIFSQRFPGRERAVNYQDLFPIQVIDGSGREVSAQFVLARYAETLYRLEKGDNEKNIQQILRSSEYNLSSVVERFKLEVLKIEVDLKYPATFDSFTPEQLDSFVKQKRIKDIVNPLGTNPGLLIEGLTLLAPEAFAGRDIAEFVRRYVGLQVDLSPDRGRVDLGQNLTDNAYLLALFAALESHQRLADMKGGHGQHIRLFIKTLRGNDDAHPEQLVEELNKQALAYQTSDQFPHGEQARALLVNLHLRAAEHFAAASQFALVRTRTAPFPYQREGARFLALRTAAILADDVGLGKTYQAAAAALAIGAKRVLWVTTAASKENVKNELLEHFDLTGHEVKVVTSLDPKKRSQQIDELNGEIFVVTNYETLVALKRRDPEQYRKLTSNLDVLVLDESQLVDNNQAQRSQAVRAIDAARVWMLTATPYQNRFENLWSSLNQIAPEQFPNRRAFIDLYAKSTSGLVLLHEVIADLMLRRTKAELVERFESSAVRSFEEQLLVRSPRVPTIQNIDPAVEGSLALSVEQEDTVAWMVADFEGWADYFNENLASEGEEIDLNTISPLLKFHWIHKALYQPEALGLIGSNPVIEEAIRLTEKRVAAGEKVLLWCWNTDVIDQLTERLQGLGARRFDGTMSLAEKAASRNAFQDDPNSKVLVANYNSGGIAQTFTAANTAIIVQLPLAFPNLLQVEGRHNRVIGLNNLKHAKEFSNVVYLVPKFSKELLQRVADPKLGEILASGTLAEQTYQRLKGARTLYNFIMEGYGDPAELERELQRSLLQGLGLLRKDSDFAQVGNRLASGKKGLIRVAERLLPVWQRVSRGGPEEAALLRFVDAYRFYPKAAQEVAQVLDRHQRVQAADLILATDIARVENKFLREALIKELPKALDNAYGGGAKSFSAECGASILGYVLKIAGQSNDSVLGSLVAELSELRDTAAVRRLTERFAMGLLGASSSVIGKRILADHLRLFVGAALKDQVTTIFQLGVLSRVAPELLTEIGAAQANFQQFSLIIHEKLHHALDDFAQRERGSAAELLQIDPSWQGSMEHLVALLAGWRALGDEQVIGQFAEICGALLDGEYLNWRNQELNRLAGREIEYLKEKGSFWSAFSKNCRLQRDVVLLSQEQELNSMVAEFSFIKKIVQPVTNRVEGPISLGVLEKLETLGFEELKRECLALAQQRRDVGMLLTTENPTAEQISLGDSYGIDVLHLNDPAKRAHCRSVVRDLEAALGWALIQNYLAEGDRSTTKPDQHLIGALTRKVGYYRQAGEERWAGHFEALANRLRQVRSGESGATVYTVEETDSPAVLSKIGNLSDSMVNCFNPVGNPVFTQYIVGVLGSRNIKAIVVRDENDHPIACAVMKLRKDSDGHPVLYLERGLASGGYDYRNEMLELLAAKAQQIEEESGVRPKVMTQIYGAVRSSDPEVFGTGGYADLEHVEAVFGLRRASMVRHHAREYLPSVELSERADAGKVQAKTELQQRQVFGIGTSNKRIESYIGELKEMGVSHLVDVRAVPFSRRFPHFSRDELQQHLERNGISYIWLGDTLGNPANERGERTLEGFVEYQKTTRYQLGLRELRKLIEASNKVVALTCSENREEECHRQFILKDIRQLLEGDRS